MASPLLEDEGLLREWSPLTDLMQQIPPKAQRGIFTQDLFLTCVDIIPEFIAVGTNLGLVYWYSRTKGDLQRLRCENTAFAITCVKIVSTVDYMVAAGSENGVVTVFQVPKLHPDSIPDSLKPKKEKQVERYTISALHTGPVSAIEWSVNGMKLFSGDKNGLIVLTEIDFYMHLSKSVELFNEKYEIVQLSFCQQHLLVSTMYRSIVCHKEERWVVAQVGQKERKTLGKFGTVFCQKSDRPQDLAIYSTRPGLRLWFADKCGTVQQTLIFKDALSVPYPEAQLINPARSYLKKLRGEDQFGPLLIFRDNLLVTYSSEVVYILNPETISIVATVCDLRSVKGVAVNKDEIFILEGERSLIRISYLPESLIKDVKPEPSLQDSSNLLSSNTSTSLSDSTIASSILDLTSKIKENAVAPIIPFQNIFNNGFPDLSGFARDWNPIVTADEAQELPPIVNIPTDNFVALKTEEYGRNGKDSFNQAQRATIDAIQEANYSRGEFLDRIGEQDYESILFKPKLKKKGKVLKKKHVLSGTESGSDSMSTHSTRSTTSDGEEVAGDGRLEVGFKCTAGISSRSPSQDTLVTLEDLAAQRDVMHQSGSQAGLKDACRSSRKPDILHNLTSPSSKAMRLDFKPDLRSPASIERDVADKERILAKVLDLDTLCLDHVNPSLESDAPGRTVEGENSYETISGNINSEDLKIETREDGGDADVDDAADKRGFPDEPDRLDSIESSLSYGPPSGSSAPPSNFASLEVSDSALELSLGEINEFEAVERADKWIQFKVPDQITNLAVCRSFVCCIDCRDHVYYSRLAGLGLRWQKLDYKASQVSFSMCGSVVWKLVKDVAYALENSSTRGPFGESWHRVANDVQFVAVGDGVVWLVSLDGRIHIHKLVSATNPFSVALPVTCPWRVSRVSCSEGAVWALTTIGEVIARIGISDSNPEGRDWRRILIPCPIAYDIAIAAKNTGWIVDPKNVIYYTSDFTETAPVWWQVLISDYIYQQSTPLQQLRNKLTDNYLVSLRSNALSMMAVGDRSIWIAEKLASNVHMNKAEFYGHKWNKVHLTCYLPSVKWQEISAEGIFENKGQLWLLSCAGDLFCSPPNSGNLHVSSASVHLEFPWRAWEMVTDGCLQALGLPSDCPIACIAASPQSLWLLSTRGRIYIRGGLSDTCIDGSSWRELSLDQMTGVHLTHVSCGCDVVWACDQQGVVYMAVGSPHSMASSAFPPVWIPADEKDQRKHIFIKVFVGPQTFMVWALDNKRNIYVREAIFNDFQLGTGWVLVGGIEAVELSVSGSAVWALSPNGSIYRRYGISQNNYIGDYWQKIPGNVSSLSASVSDGIWALDKSVSLLRHDQILVRLMSDSPVSKPLDTASACGIDASEWEVL